MKREEHLLRIQAGLSTQEGRSGHLCRQREAEVYGLSLQQRFRALKTAASRRKAAVLCPGDVCVVAASEND